MAPLAAINVDVLKVELAKLQSDLRQQFLAAGVPDLVQAHIAKTNYCSIAKFQVFAFDMPGVLTTCRRIGLDPDESVENMTDSASVALAWQNC